jgi:glutamate-1-semialdehyde 2,1-aminomutase
MMTVFFTDKREVKSYEDAKSCNTEIFKKYFLHMLQNGFNIPQSQFEAVFLSSEHTEEHIDKFLEAFRSLEI